MTLDNYPGAKTNTGIIQFLVNEIPHHRRYFELCAGSAQLYKHKRPAAQSFLNDLNPEVAAALKELYPQAEVMNFNVHRFIDRPENFTREDFIYLDPPYPLSARRSREVCYEHEMMSDDDHNQLLMAVLQLDANVMISTRAQLSSNGNSLYDNMLNGWRKKEMLVRSHRDVTSRELIYMNYATPAILHQYDMLGDDYIDRQHIKRKVKRFTDKINRLPVHQKHLLMQILIDNNPAGVQHFLTVADGEKK